MDGIVAVAVELVNAATPGQRQGRPYVVPDGDDLTDALTIALGVGRRHHRAHLSVGEARELAAAARRLRAVFEALADDDADRAAQTLNRVMSDTGVQPQLEQHDGQAWHLHFHAHSGSVATHWTASCALGLAVVVGSDHAERLGVCVAGGCDRVYVDVSRNGRRRFCSTACQNRTKAAAYRARRG